MRRRDVRRFAPGPYVPAVAAVDRIRLDAPITLLAGEKGSGKSTIVEAIAESMGFARR